MSNVNFSTPNAESTIERPPQVRHPGVRDVIHRDFVIINFVARVSSLMPGLKWLRLEESVQQFAVFMMAQVGWRFST